MITGPALKPRARSVAISRVRAETAVYMVLRAPKSAPRPMSRAMGIPRPVIRPVSSADCSE
jgi:hypothetical protein